jgi:hypothetical protein
MNSVLLRFDCVNLLISSDYLEKQKEKTQENGITA